jgi:hypothetical protein
MNEDMTGGDYDKRNLSVVICDTDIPYWKTNFRNDDFNLTTRNVWYLHMEYIYLSW